MLKITINNAIAHIVTFEDTKLVQKFLDTLSPLNVSHEEITAIDIIDIESTITDISNLSRFTNLEEFSCVSAPLTSLPELPKNLLNLECTDCQLTSLPQLPETLKILHCQGNQLKSLPQLPANLFALDCSNNKLSHLPRLPHNLYGLNASNNQLLALPKLPNSLKIIEYENNVFNSVNESLLIF
jgi:hypothetical protein